MKNISDRDGVVSFADVVLGYYAVGAATPDDKCDAVIRLYDVHGDVRNERREQKKNGF
jgi:hypothetical protein